jgi:RES domain-containing protein
VIPGLPPRLDGVIHAWRLDRVRHAASWDSGEGAFRAGGRWNSKGRRAVYCALDPATAILEVAVHRGFRVLDTEPHVLTALALPAMLIHVLRPADVPNPNWLVPGIPSAGQQQFGDALLAAHGMVAVPSVVSRHSWNLVFDAARGGGYALHGQERFALDPRLQPAEP